MATIVNNQIKEVRDFIAKKWSTYDGEPKAFAESYGFKQEEAPRVNYFSKFSKKLGIMIRIYFSPACNGWGCMKVNNVV